MMYIPSLTAYCLKKLETKRDKRRRYLLIVNLCKHFQISKCLFSSVEIDNEEIKYICDNEMNPPDHCVFLRFFACL